jgi:D-serine deaminase-like pyridoxal phosphate-dependent protein
MTRDYEYYRGFFRGRLMPFAFVDLDLFDANAQAIRERARARPIRVASKSLRCVALLRRILQSSPQFRAVMAYSVREAVFLSQQGVSDDILVAYPVWREAADSGLCEELRAGKRITLMVDCEEHIGHLERTGAAWGVCIPLCLDLDMSSRYPGLHFGVRRSGVTTPARALELWKHIRGCRYVSLDGVMGYEAQIASVQDDVPGSPLRRRLIRVLKQRSIREVARRRGAIVEALRQAGCTPRFVNGGGTGSIETTIEDNVVSEVTVGSGFYAPASFDRFAQFRHLPAAGFAIEITRRPTPEIYTCHGGGYVASGAAGPGKSPLLYLPEGARLIAQEGAGEVQTPIVYDGPERLGIGDPIFLRHSKAGELCERFNTLLLVSDGKIVDEVNTYRGDGRCFL